MSDAYRRSPNPNNLSEKEILELVKFCPVCGTPWPKGKHRCANREECGLKVRVEPNAFNWWLFYPKVNGWALLRD